MTDKLPNRNTRLVVLLLWILLGLLYSSLAYDYIVASNNDKKLGEYLQYIVVLSGDGHKDAREVRSLVLIKSEELGISLLGDQIGISGTGPKLKIIVNYEVEILLPILRRAIYRMVFHHEAVYRSIR